MRIAWTLVTGLLLAGYFYLNAGKIAALDTRLGDIAAGAPAKAVTLVADGAELLTFRVPSSDIFDDSGTRQVVVQPVAQATIDALKERLAEVGVEYGGEAIAGTPTDAGLYLGLGLPGRKIYLVPEDKFPAFAGIVARERMPGPPVIACIGEDFCGALSITGGTGIGPEQGPFLATEEDRLIRGMPRGHWGYGPATTLKIVAQQDIRAVLGISFLQLSDTQRITFSDNVRVVRAEEGPHAGVPPLVARSYLAELTLRRGENEVEIHYSDSWGPNRWTSRPLAAYITGLRVAAPRPPGGAPRD